MEVIETKMATNRVIGEHILLATLKENVEMDLAAIKENHEASMQLMKGGRHVSLVDARKYKSITDEAKKYAAQPNMYTHVIAQAVIVASVVTKLMANFIFNFTNQNKKVEMKVFTDYDEALAWLKEKLFEEQAELAIAKFKAKHKG